MEEARFTLRLPAWLKEELEMAAAADRRSLNTKTVLALEQWVRDHWMNSMVRDTARRQAARRDAQD